MPSYPYTKTSLILPEKIVKEPEKQTKATTILQHVDCYSWSRLKMVHKKVLTF